MIQQFLQRKLFLMRVLILSCAFLLLMPWLMHFAWFILDFLCVFLLLLFHFQVKRTITTKAGEKKTRNYAQIAHVLES